MADIYKNFGGRVKALRARKHLTQEELAYLTGLHRTYISDVERGLRSVSLKNIEKIAVALEVQIFELFKWE